MIVLIVCLFFIVMVWNLAGIYFKFWVAWIGLIIQIIKLAWRLLAMVYNRLRGRRGGSPPQTPAKPQDGGQGGNPIGSADVRPLKNDRPVNSRISDYYRK